MHIFFSGIGGAAIGPLALIAKQAGYEVSGSDKQNSSYLTYLQEKGINSITVDQSHESIAKIHADNPIDWYVYSSAVRIENPDAPELEFCSQNNIKMSKRDELLNKIIEDKNLKLIAIAGTHGKTTTTAMVIWLFKQLSIPVSYSVGAKLSFGEPGEYNPNSKYFIYEADEYDRNFLNFKPHAAIIPGIAYDHPDIYPTQEEYNNAFRQFIDQSEWYAMWAEDAKRLGLNEATDALHKEDYTYITKYAPKLVGEVNRYNAALACQEIASVLEKYDVIDLMRIMNDFPGLSRRFEAIVANVYSDYAHTPEKIMGALQTAHEVAGDNVVVVYEGLHNTRQHFIKEDLRTLFNSVKNVYVVPSYRAREDESLEDLTPAKLIELFDKKDHARAVKLNDDLKKTIKAHAKNGNLVLCLSAGGGNSLDEWLRKEFS